MNKTELDQLQRAEYLKEYELTQQMAIHYDIMNWQIGSILIAGIFISIGVVGNRFEAYPILGVISLFILFVWNRFYFRHKAIQNSKFERLHELEELLQLRQHLQIKEKDTKTLHRGIHGVQMMNILTYGLPTIIFLAYAVVKVKEIYH